MALKDGRYKGPNWATRRALLDMLKVEGELTSLVMAERLGISTMAVRQHMHELEASDDVASRDVASGKGRPTKVWSLTKSSVRHFADRHRDLMVDLLGQMENVLGEAAIEKLLDARGAGQIEAYRARLSKAASKRERIALLAEIRSEEGYMAHVEGDETGAWFLMENHCPICTAAEACRGLCSRELEVFQASLGNQFKVERVEHLLSGGRRCSYRIESKG